MQNKQIVIGEVYLYHCFSLGRVKRKNMRKGTGGAADNEDED